MQRLRPDTRRMYVSLARSILVEVATCKRKDKFITYKDLMDEMGGPGRGYIAEVLDEVSSREHKNGRPLITALVVHSIGGLPGWGFWYISTLPSSVNNMSDEQKILFWEEECRKVWNCKTW